MKHLKKTISVLLAALMLLFIVQTVASATSLLENEAVTIFVDGVNSEDLISTETGEKVFPPSTDDIVAAVKSCVLPVAGSLVTRNWSVLTEPLSEAVRTIFNPIVCDENGDPVATTINWNYPSEKKIREQLAREDLGAQIKFAFDWRLDLQTIASQLHDYIEYVMPIAGVRKVNLIGFSMGSCAVMSYLKMYDYEYVNSVVLLAGAYNGVSVCGQPFSGHVILNGDAIVRYVGCMAGKESFIAELLQILNRLGILDSVCNLGNDLTDAIGPDVYENVLSKTFATMPGLWALIPPEYYEEACELIGGGLSDTLKAKIAWYHDEVQVNNKEIIDGIFERGLNFGMVAKYGYSGMPVMEAYNNNSDGMIDTKYESFGATVADIDSTLGDGYTQAVDVGFDCISPDNIIDASTGMYPEYTWYIKNSYHSDNYKPMMELAYSIIKAPEQVTVNTGKYSQFLYCTADEQLAVLTADNDPGSIYAEGIGDSVFSHGNTGIAARIKEIFTTLIERFKSLFKAGC